nr:uncharacterized protein CTRU02_03478 [Colletotrichum truncatum]KAF6797447.1 hypothetical protein CTRU02_03478 [Colletotrichum truncatum]
MEETSRISIDEVSRNHWFAAAEVDPVKWPTQDDARGGTDKPFGWDPSGGHTFRLFTLLPKELHDKVLLMSIDLVVVNNRETRALVCHVFGAPGLLGFLFSPARDIVYMHGNVSTLFAGYRFTEDCRSPGSVVTGGVEKGWPMPSGLRRASAGHSKGGRGGRGVYDVDSKDLYTVDQLNMLDKLEDMADDGVVLFPK